MQQGTIASMFNVYTKLGKLYVFDIQRTYREVYDHARRVLHAKGVDYAATSLLNEVINESNKNSDEIKFNVDKEVAERISEAMTCRICMDREINTSFTPCGHITSCYLCADK